MSKIVFWSPFHGLGQTSNLHILACALSLIHHKQVVIMQTQMSMNNLEYPLVGRGMHQEKSEELLQEIGLDMAITFHSMGQLNKSLLECCCLTFPQTSLMLLPGTQVKNKESFQRDIASVIYPLTCKMDEFMDYILIDANSGKDILSKKLIEFSDFVIVNLSQGKYVLETLFAEYGEFLYNNPKIFYLFGAYDDGSIYNIHNCRVKYHRYINRNNSGTIPYNTQFLDASNTSKVLSFMEKGLQEDMVFEKMGKYMMNRIPYRSTLIEDKKYFFHYVKHTLEKILNQINKVTYPSQVEVV